MWACCNVLNFSYFERRFDQITPTPLDLLQLWFIVINAVLSVRFEGGVSLLQAPTGTDKRGKAPFPLVENAGIQLAIRKRVPARAPAGAGSYWKHCNVSLICINFLLMMLICQSLLLTIERISSGFEKKKTWIPACPLGKTPSNFACPLQVFNDLVGRQLAWSLVQLGSEN